MASILDHTDAQYNLTILSNHIDINENDDETVEETIEKQISVLHDTCLRLSSSSNNEDEHLFNDYQLDLKNQTVTSLS